MNSSFWRRISPFLVIGGLLLLGMLAYLYPAPVADVGDTYNAPVFAQAALRSFIIAQIIRAFYQRWDEFTPSGLLGWTLIAVGIIFNLARGLFSDTPLTFSFACLHVGLIIVTWRLMAATKREARLARSLHESEQIRIGQDAVISELQADKTRIGQQSKEFEVRARAAETRIAELEMEKEGAA